MACVFLGIAMANPFAKINRALSRKKADAEGVQRKGLDLDEETRKKREEERIARARAERFKQMGIK